MIERTKYKDMEGMGMDFICISKDDPRDVGILRRGEGKGMNWSLVHLMSSDEPNINLETPIGMEAFLKLKKIGFHFYQYNQNDPTDFLATLVLVMARYTGAEVTEAIKQVA